MGIMYKLKGKEMDKEIETFNISNDDLLLLEIPLNSKIKREMAQRFFNFGCY